MTPDVNIKDYYLQYIFNAKNDINKYKELIEECNKNIIIVKEYISKCKDTIKEVFNIDIENTDEWSKGEYCKNEHLYQTCIKLLKDIDEHPNKIDLLQVIKYCNILRNKHKYGKLIILANKRKDIKFSTYRKYVTAYYNAVHRCVLSGMGYKFNYGIGTYVINHWKLDKDKMKNKRHIDFAATNKRKKELIKEGKHLYDEKEALWYKSRGIPYDGVDYRVYKTNTDWYEFIFINCNIVKSSKLEYKRTEYINAKYRGMSYKEMADKLCKNEEDVYNLQVDIKYKLNILLYKDPTKYLNYIRNAEQCKYKY